MQLQDRIPNVSDDKIKFFGLICIIVVIIIICIIAVILPHLTHPSMVYHILLHIASLTIAIFLCSIAVAAYFRGGRTRLLFMALDYIGGTGGPIATFCNRKFTRTNSSHGKCRVTPHSTFSYDISVWCRNIEGELVIA